MTAAEAWLVRVTDNKRGVTDPAIVGPFPDVEAAERFRDEYEMDEVDDFDGGYAACHTVSRDSYHQTPQEYAAEWGDRAREWLADQDKDGAVT